MKQLLSELAAQVGGQVDGDGSLLIEGVAGLAEAAPAQLSFFGHNKYRREFEATRASAVLVSGDEPRVKDGPTLVRVPNPHLAFARISQLFHPPRKFSPGISPKADVHPEAKVHPTATVMAFVSVAQGAVIGPRVVLHPQVSVGIGASIGEDSVLHPGVAVYEGCAVGKRCVLHANSVVGSDGFGFAFDLETPAHVKIPQAGIARLEDDVELGASSCVDRATLGETVVGQGTKIDNLVQVGHNVRIGPHSILCAQAGVSGSSELGTGVVLGGQAGIAGHLKIHDLAKVAAQAGVGHDVEAGAAVGGSPAFDAGQWRRAAIAFAKVPELVKDVRALKRRLDDVPKEPTP